MSILVTPGNNTGWGLGATAMRATGLGGGYSRFSRRHPVGVNNHYRRYPRRRGYRRIYGLSRRASRPGNRRRRRYLMTPARRRFLRLTRPRAHRRRRR